MTRIGLSLLTIASAVMSTTASADYALYRTADDQLFTIAAEARSLRWDVAVAPIRENDRRNWLRGLDDIYDEVVDIQKSLFRSRTPDHVCRQIGDLREEVCELRDDLNRLGHPTAFRYERGLGGQRIRCGVLPGGCMIPAQLVARLDQLDHQAEALHQLIATGSQPAIGSVYPRNQHLQTPLFQSRPSLTPPLPAPRNTAPSVTPNAVPLPAPPLGSRYDRFGSRNDRLSRTEAAIGTMNWILSQISR